MNFEFVPCRKKRFKKKEKRSNNFAINIARRDSLQNREEFAGKGKNSTKQEHKSEIHWTKRFSYTETLLFREYLSLPYVFAYVRTYVRIYVHIYAHERVSGSSVRMVPEETCE